MSLSAAEERQKRLAALREAAGASAPAAAAAAPGDSKADAAPVFRNYRPRDEAMAETMLQPRAAPAAPAVLRYEADLAGITLQNQFVRGKGSGGAAAAAEADAPVATRKENWDLKRDLERRLKVLGPQTEAAVAELVRRRADEEEQEKDGEYEYEYESESDSGNDSVDKA
jgi:hypothetical protein